MNRHNLPGHNGLLTGVSGILILATDEPTTVGAARHLHSFRGKPVLRRIAENALALNQGPVAVLTAPGSMAMRDTLSDLDVQVLEDPHWKRGAVSSFRVGLGVLQEMHPRLDGLLCLLCDQPLVGISSLRSLLDAPSGISAAAYLGTTGFPAWISRAFFPEFLTLPDHQAWKAFLHRHQKRVTRVNLPEAAMDIDFVVELSRSGD